MDHPRDLLDAATKLRPDMVERLGTLVSAESAPGDLPHLESCADLLARWGEEVLGRPAERVVVDGLPHLLWPAARQRVLLLGHFDTVFPIGTVRSRPFTVRGDIATGPGVCDMKAGIVQMFTALGAAGGHLRGRRAAHLRRGDRFRHVPAADRAPGPALGRGAGLRGEPPRRGR